MDEAGAGKRPARVDWMVNPERAEIRPAKTGMLERAEIRPAKTDMLERAEIRPAKTDILCRSGQRHDLRGREERKHRARSQAADTCGAS